MTAFHETLTSMRRPRLLVRAARFGLQDYNRNRDLKRILREQDVASPGANLPRLVDLEASHEATRVSGDATYSVASHLEILIALMAEIRLFGGGKSQA